MQFRGLVYRVTDAGRRSLSDPSVPADYRRILGVVGTEAHSDVIRSLLRRYPDQLILEWLDELTELELLTPVAEKPGHDLDFMDDFQLPQLLVEDQQRLAAHSELVCDLLSRKGVYVATERAANRAPLGREPEDSDILIVEDDPDQLRLAKTRVAMAGYAVRTAGSVHELRHRLMERVPDLLLLDVMLPDGNGFDILSNIRRNARTALLPVVLLTVRDEPSDIHTGLALGADGYVTKPYSKAALAELIQYVLAPS